MLATALFMIGISPAFTLFVFFQQISLVVDTSMATTLLFGLFVSVLCAGHTISREMRNGTVLLLLSKPVTRFSFIIAKVLGILTAVTIFTIICNCATIVASIVAIDQFNFDAKMMLAFFIVLLAAAVFGGLRNYFAHASFSANSIIALLILLPVTAGLCYMFRYSQITNIADVDTSRFIFPYELIPGLLLLFPAIWIMAAIAVTLATRLEFVTNLLICFAIFIIGLVSRYMISQLGFESGGILSHALRALFPNWQYFWMADALSSRTFIPPAYIAWSLIYAVFYITIWVAWAVYLFQDRELARDSR